MFTHHDGIWQPTEYSRGPWNPEHCHGGPVSALLARVVESIDDGGDVPWQVARLTIELLRPDEHEAVLEAQVVGHARHLLQGPLVAWGHAD